VVGRVRTGDVDRGEWLNELAAGAHVTDVGAVRAASGGSVERDVSLTIDAQRGSRGWLYAQAPLRVGAQLRLRTPDYDLSGIVLDVTPRWSDTAAR
jgi:hypothetical protein